MARLVDQNWPESLKRLLAEISVVSDIDIRHYDFAAKAMDGVVDFTVDGLPRRLFVEAMAVAQPKQARVAVERLRRMLQREVRDDVPSRGMMVAPFISPDVRKLLHDEGVDWLDMAGNARIWLPGLYLSVTEANRDPSATKRQLRSLFYPKSARVLKHLLLQPHRLWMGKELAEVAQVSVGLVSKVRQALQDREWATGDDEGLRLTTPSAVLDAWRSDGVKSPPVTMRYYTILHGRPLQAALVEAFREIKEHAANARLGSHSVAGRKAPFARVTGEFIYADQVAQPILRNWLKLVPADTGENVTLFRADDEGPWQQPMRLEHELVGTDAIQTYLDMLATGERGREAAEHWRREVIEKRWVEA